MVGKRWGRRAVVVAVVVAAVAAGVPAADWGLRAYDRWANPPAPTPEFPPALARLQEALRSHGEGDDFRSRKSTVGGPASDFTLASVADGKPVRLADFRGKPVVLVFGSFSCDIFCSRLAELEQLYQDERNRAAFLFVNVTEAGHEVPGYEFVIEGTALGRPQPEAVRRERTAKALAKAGLTMPAVTDADDGPTERAYDAFPLRVVVVDADGRLALDLGRGIDPTWDLGEVRRWLDGRP